MSEYTPTTDEVRGDYAHFQVPGGTRPVTGEFTEGIAEFNRWLAEVERAAAAKAWERFVDMLSAHHEDRAPNVVADMERRNPYRRNEGEKDSV